MVSRSLKQPCESGRERGRRGAVCVCVWVKEGDLFLTNGLSVSGFFFLTLLI